jgi:hypothetical protein
MSYEETITALTEDQQRVINDKFKEVKQFQEEWALNEVARAKEKLEKQGAEQVAQIKKHWKDAANTVRKPEFYTKEKDIRAYIQCWNQYKTVMDLSDEVARLSFMTYLDPDSSWKIKLAEVDNIPTWAHFCAGVIATLDEPKLKLALKHQLRNLKQGPAQSVTEFYNRMLEIADKAFTDEDQVEREAILKDTLCSGLRSEPTAIEIMEHDDWSFKKALAYAIKRDTVITARKQMAEGETSEMAILKVDISEEDREAVEGQNSKSGRPLKCFNCGMQGHIAAECPNKRRCYFCNIPGHIKKDCFKYQRKLKEEKRRGITNDSKPKSWARQSGQGKNGEYSGYKAEPRKFSKSWNNNSKVENQNLN